MKKTGTEKFIPKIKSGFVMTMTEKYGIKAVEAENLIVSFIKVIEDASDYLFSENHSVPYTMIGYMCGYLRWKYPLEFVTSALCIFNDDREKSARITQYAKNNNIEIRPIKFRKSKSNYFCDKEQNCVYKGLSSVMNVGTKAADELYSLKDQQFENFTDLLITIKEKCPSVHNDALSNLAKLHFFDEFGDPNHLLKQIEMCKLLYGKKKIKKDFSNVEKAGVTAAAAQLVIDQCAIKECKSDWAVDMNKFMKLVADSLDFTPQTPTELVKAQVDYLGYIDYKNSNMGGYGVVIKEDVKYTPKLKIYSIRNGVTREMRCKRDLYKVNPIVKGDFIIVDKCAIRPKNIMGKNGKWEKSKSEKELHLLKYRKVDSLKESDNGI